MDTQIISVGCIEDTIDETVELGEDNVRILAKVSEYYSRKPMSTAPRQRVYDVAKKYFDLLDLDETITLSKIADPLELWAPQVSRILNGMNLRVNEHGRFYPRTNQEQARAIENGLRRTSMTFADISYFTGVSAICVLYRARGMERRVETPVAFGRNGFATRKNLSKIYQLDDKGKTEEEVLRRLKINKQLYDHAMEESSRYKPEIIRDVSLMWPLREITGPYLNFRPRYNVKR